MVDFAPEAEVLATMPADPSNAVSQRERWERGRSPVIRKYAGRLLIDAFRKRSFRSLDALIDLLTPPLVKLLALAGAAASIHGLFRLLRIDILGEFALPWLVVFFLGVVHVLVGLLVGGADASLYGTIRHIPRYIVWKLKIYIRSAVHGSTRDWVRTTRERRLFQESLNETGRSQES